MPRILLSTAHIAPRVLNALDMKFTAPSLVTPHPPLPEPFLLTVERIQRLQEVDADAHYEAQVASNLASAKEPFCNDIRSRPKI